MADVLTRMASASCGALIGPPSPSQPRAVTSSVSLPKWLAAAERSYSPATLSARNWITASVIRGWIIGVRFVDGIRLNLVHTGPSLDALRQSTEAIYPVGPNARTLATRSGKANGLVM